MAAPQSVATCEPINSSLVEIDEVPDRAGDVGLAVVMTPDVSVPDDVRDVEVINPTVLAAELTPISVRNAGETKRRP